VQVADQAVLGDWQVAHARRPSSTGHDSPSWTSTDVARHAEPPRRL
jgi:hypothetical protein